MNRIANVLGIKYPFIQGPMAWLTDAKFVAAVSNAGGLGILGPNAGQDSVTSDPVATAERMRNEIKKVQALTDQPFGVVLIASDGDSSSEFTMAILKVVIEEQVPVALVNSVSSMMGAGYGVSDELLEPLKAHHIKTIVRSLQPSIKEAQTIEAQGADVYVATGFDEGGTLPGAVLGSFSIVPMIADAGKMPIALAGGVSDARTVKAAMALGAEGVYVGSRLIPTVENPAAQVVKQLIVDSNAEDLALFRTAPAYYRSLPTKLTKQLVQNDQTESLDKVQTDNAKLMGVSQGMKLGMLDGDLEHGFVSVGTGISTIHAIEPVATVVESMMAGYEN